eukprot:57185-Eustigmatos_ZCMA.PRE.1
MNVTGVLMCGWWSVRVWLTREDAAPEVLSSLWLQVWIEAMDVATGPKTAQHGEDRHFST